MLAPGPHLSVPVGSTPAPSSAHSAHTLVHVKVHVKVHVHITVAPPYPHPSPLYLFVCCVGVGVGDAVLVDSPCRPASRLPCCPAASTAQCSVVRDWTAHPVRPPSSSRQNLARGRNQPSTSGLQPPIGAFSTHEALRQATINKPVGSMSCSPAQPSSLGPVYLHPSLPYHK